MSPAKSIGPAVDRLTALTSLDPVVDRVGALALTLPVGVRDALHGTWLGHPLHPALAQLPVGAWLASAVLDVVSAADAVGAPARAPGVRHAATVLVATGLAGVPAAAAAGFVDWAQLHPEHKRVGAVHAAANAVGTGLLAASLVARLRGRHGRGRVLGLLGVAASGLGAGLGGHLAYRWAAGANHAEEVPHVTPGRWTDVAQMDDLPERRPVARSVGGTTVALVRDGGRVRAIADVCSHLSGPLSEGEVTTESGVDCLVCPWHGSAFRLDDGGVVHGPATAPAPVFDVRVADGTVSVRVRPVEASARPHAVGG